jgi:hypothetical protein
MTARWWSLSGGLVATETPARFWRAAAEHDWASRPGADESVLELFSRAAITSPAPTAAPLRTRFVSVCR